jgi:hypothetical protein
MREVHLYSLRSWRVTDAPPSVRELDSQHTLLQTRLLSLRAQHTLSSPPLSITPSPDASQTSTIPDSELTNSDDNAAILSLALSRSSRQSKAALANLYRVAGTTTFTVQPPNEAEKLLGIRLDVFSARKGTFGNPYYLLLSPVREPKTTAKLGWGVVRHSLPAFIGVAELEKKFLPLMGMKEQRLELFVQEVRRRVIRWRRRVDMAEEVKQIAKGIVPRIGDLGESWVMRVEEVVWDVEVLELRVRWGNGTVGVGRVDERGIVREAVLRDGKGKRRREQEVLMKGMLSAMPRRMGWDAEEDAAKDAVGGSESLVEL